jgi:hypothetical protein
VAGATANNTNVPRGIADVQQQVQQYLTYMGNASLPFESTLYAIWIGVNDIHDIYTNDSPDQQSEKVKIAAESVLNAVKNLYEKSKARRFLLLFLRTDHPVHTINLPMSSRNPLTIRLNNT